MSEIQRDLKLSPARIFLSYAREDRDRVREVYLRLKQERLNPWLDEEDLLPGQEWQRVLLSAIREARFVLVFLSSHSVSKRGYVQKEIARALDVAEELPEGEAYIIPVRLDDCTIPERLGKWQWVNLFETDGLARLLRGIRVHLYGRDTVEAEAAAPARRPAAAAELDRILTRKFVAAGKFFFGELDEHRVVISNGHLLEYRQTGDPTVRWLRDTLTDEQELTAPMLERAIPAAKEYRNDRHLLRAVKDYPSKPEYRILESRGGTLCGVDADYLDYARRRYPDAALYVSGPERPIVAEEHGEVACVIMPVTLPGKG